MKYVFSFLTGLIFGALLFVTALYYNPFTSQQAISPLAVTNERIVDLTFTNVPGESILFTNNG
ncbi:MAG: hypothetical protein ACI88G_000864, partial [Woeseiaceae bacterium]